MLAKPSASDAKGAPAPIMWTDCRASVLSAHAGGHGFRRTPCTFLRDDPCFLLLGRTQHYLLCVADERPKVPGKSWVHRLCRRPPRAFAHRAHVEQQGGRARAWSARPWAMPA